MDIFLRGVQINVPKGQKRYSRRAEFGDEEDGVVQSAYCLWLRAVSLRNRKARGRSK